MTPTRKKHPLKIIPLGGLGEIGLNCMILHYEDEIIVIDCGVLFSDLQMLGVDFFIPDFSYLQEHKDKIKAYIITHGHEDHIGALPFAYKNMPAPIYCTNFAQKLIETKLTEHGLAESVKFKIFKPGETFKFKNFSITAQSVNHSIVEAMALFIDSPQGLLVHTGDFKIDANPYYGDPLDPEPFMRAGKKGVRLLMSDSTNVERDGHSLSEEMIYYKFQELFSKSKGLTIIAVFASNVGRVGQVLELVRKQHKKLALLGRSMEQNCRLAYEAGYLEGLNEVLIPLEEIAHYPRSSVVVLSTGSQGEYRSGLMRIANNEHRNVKLTEGDLIIMSSKFIPGNEKAISQLINSLFKQGADVLYESVDEVHVSGHANAEELTKMIQYTKPEFFIPVHGEYRHLVRHKKLALAHGLTDETAQIAVNGDIFELRDDGLFKVDHFDENRIMIEGATRGDVTKVVLKDRRKVAETGIVFAILIRNSVSGKIMAGPDLLSKGFLDESDAKNHLMEKAKEVMLSIVTESQKKSKKQSIDIQEEIRIGLRRFFNAKLGKKPVVIPILIDV